jgi:hypothetical protein
MRQPLHSWFEGCLAVLLMVSLRLMVASAIAGGHEVREYLAVLVLSARQVWDCWKCA